MTSRSNLDEMTSHDIWSLSTGDLVELAVKYKIDIPYVQCCLWGHNFSTAEVDEDELVWKLILLRNERLAEAAVNENR